MSDGPRYIVSFDDVHAECGGIDISAISEIRLMAAANGIPQITLSVDGQTSDGTGSGAADGVSLENARTIFDNCRSMVRTDSATLSLSLTCRYSGPDGEQSQTLNLNGWMLVDVALSPVQRKGVCTASLTFVHPLYKAHLGGATVGILAQPADLQYISGNNPLDLFISAVEAYAVVPRSYPRPVSVKGAADLATVQSSLDEHLSKALSALRSSLAWEGGGLPAASSLADQLPSLYEGFATAYAAPASGNSLLQTLLSSIIPECSLALGGDYMSGTLTLRPFEPWSDASVDMPDSNIVSLDFPQVDPSPISGVRFIVGVDSGGDLVSWNALGCQSGSGSVASELFYVPDSELYAEHMYGPIQQFTEPSWLLHTAKCSVNRRDGNASDVSVAKNGAWNSAVNVPRGGSAALSGVGGTPAAMSYAEAALRCVKAYFETSLMKDWGFTVSARLMFKAGGDTLCPGKVMRVTTSSGDVVSGYIARVEHIISVPSRAAVTRVTCTHPRFGSLPAAITSTGNALYSE